jgi:hypothetical protein
MLARALEQLAPIIKDGKVVDLDYSRLLDPTFARQMLDVCYPDVWASLEMLAEGGAFDHFKEVGFYVDVGRYLDVILKLGDPDSYCPRHHRDSHRKNVRRSNGIWESCSDMEHARMSQCLRRLV